MFSRRIRMQPDGGRGGHKRGHALCRESGDDAGQHIARTGGGQRGGAVMLDDGSTVGGGDDGVGALVDEQRLQRGVVLRRSGRTAGSGTSKVVLETMHRESSDIKDHLCYLTQTSDGRTLKSSTLFIRDDEGKIRYILSINYDITDLMSVGLALKNWITVEPDQGEIRPEPIVSNVNDLLESLIRQSVELVGKPVARMTKEDKIKAIQFLNDAGAFLVTKSGDKVSEYFGISKFTLYNYMSEVKDDNL